MMNQPRQLANFITLSRILGVGYIFWLAPFKTNLGLLIGVIVFTLLCLTDFLDGWIARKYQIVSDVGKVLDPLADKILVLVFLPLLSMQMIAAFPVFVILAREFSVMALRVFSAKQGLIIPAGISGKLKTAITFPVCGLLMGRVPVETLPSLPVPLLPLEWLRQWVISWPQSVMDGLVWAMVGITIWSFFDYLAKFMWQRSLLKTDHDVQKAKQQLLVIVPNAITFFNLFSGILSVFSVINGNVKVACAFILLGTVLDAFDGLAARKFGVDSRLGASLDSIADFVTFGVAPAVVIMFMIMQFDQPLTILMGLVMGIGFYASVHYRLVRFSQGGHSDYFDGLPSPSGASFVAVVTPAVWLGSTWMFIGICGVAMLAMVSKWPYPHNRITNQMIPFKWIKWPVFVFWNLTILSFFGVPIPAQWHVADITIIGNTIYLLAPLFPKPTPITTTH